MKKLMKASLLVVAMSATSVWASILAPKPFEVGVSEEALVIANMIHSEPVQDCIREVQERFRGEVVIEDIRKRTPHDLRNFNVQVAVLVGGDAYVGGAEIIVKKNVGIPWGVTYKCHIVRPAPGLVMEDQLVDAGLSPLQN